MENCRIDGENKNDDLKKKKSVQQIVTPNQSVGADGVNNLSAKVTMTMLPPNQTFFKFAMDEMVMKEQGGENPSQYKIDVNKGLSRIEKMLLDYQEQSNDVRWLHERGNKIWNEWMVDPDGIYRTYTEDENGNKCPFSIKFLDKTKEIGDIFLKHLIFN